MTPFLDSLARDTSVICFPHVLPQVKDGRSSDAQLLLNTGLLPIETGAAASLYGSTNTYPSLPKALARKGYASASFICDSRSYWNQEATTKSYGFGALHEKLGEGGPRSGPTKTCTAAPFRSCGSCRSRFTPSWSPCRATMP